MDRLEYGILSGVRKRKDNFTENVRLLCSVIGWILFIIGSGAIVIASFLLPIYCIIWILEWLIDCLTGA